MTGDPLPPHDGVWMSDSLRGVLHDGDHEPAVMPVVRLCDADGNSLIEGQLVEIVSAPGAFSVALLTTLASLRNALECIEPRRVVISMGEEAMHSRDIQVHWNQSREIRPDPSGNLLFVLSVMREDK